MRISMIAAMAKNRVIGHKNALPWHLPEDLRHFRDLTMGHHILMGRKTFESIGKPLPGRQSVVISRNPDFVFPGVEAASSIEEAILLCSGDEEVFFIGGADLYNQAIRLAQRIYLTEIQDEYEGDAYFPRLDPSEWFETSREVHEGYHFAVYDRKGA
jgi:dihydrofolate reductase